MVSKTALFVACLVLLLANGEALLLKALLLHKKKMAMAKLHHLSPVSAPAPAIIVEPKRTGENMVAPKRTGENMVAPKRTGERMIAPKRTGEMEMEDAPAMGSAEPDNFMVREDSMSTPRTGLRYRIMKLKSGATKKRGT